MKINILLHDFSRRNPFGGIKQQYEFANHLSSIGHDVAVYHSLNFDRTLVSNPRSVVGMLRCNLRGSKAISWFTVDENVRCRFVPRTSPLFLRKADVTIVSSFLVTERLVRRTRRTGIILYIVYEFPIWQSGPADLRERLMQSLTRTDVGYIATSIAVEEMLLDSGIDPIAKINCGINVPLSTFVPPTSSRLPIVGFALRPEPHKAVVDMLKAIPRIRDNNPDVQFECFGRYSEVSELPEGLKVHGYLSDEELVAFYRRCMIFVSPSHAEGWGLTAAEAMANGAAVVVTQDGGSRDFAIDGVTALVVPPCDPQSIADATTALLDDPALRSTIASGGMRRCEEMSWEGVVAQLDALLAEGASHSRARVAPTPS